MKTRCIHCLLSLWVVVFLSVPVWAQDDVAAADSTGLPGDNFSLEGAIDLFKKAESPEDFEKLLNSEDNHVNNLDLNEDGEIDYIRVVDNVDGDVHALVLQVPVSETESQDIAVIEIEKKGDEEAILQIVGDPDIYGEQTIAEPFEEEQVKNGRGGPTPQIAPVRIVVNVWLWPSVRFVYRPGYTAWVSPWRWRVYPRWWSPWRPYPWHRYHVWVAPYRSHYRVVGAHRVVRAHAVYAPRRTSSTVVHTRTTTVVARRGPRGTTVGKRSTTRTTTTGPRGGTVTKQRTTTKAARQGQNGRAAGKKTTTRVTKKRGRG